MKSYVAAEPKVLTCAVCLEEWVRPAQTGRLPKRCPACTGRPIPQAPQVAKCQVCGAEFSREATSRRRYCSDECFQAHERQRSNAYRATKYPQTRKCECGTEFVARTRVRRYCDTCRSAQRWEVKCKLCGVHFQARTNRASVCGAEECRLEKQRERQAKFLQDYEARTGAPFRATLSPTALENRRSHHKARRAALRGARVEKFTSLEIYERDGWTCRLCLAPVDPAEVWPSPKSPSLDHVTPIVLGGEHSRANTQLAHLGCNSAEGQFWRQMAKEQP